MISVVLEVPSQVKAESSYYQTSLMNDNYLILSIGLTLLSVCFGCFPALFFSIPAIVYSVKVSTNPQQSFIPSIDSNTIQSNNSLGSKSIYFGKL